VKLFKVIL